MRNVEHIPDSHTPESDARIIIIRDVQEMLSKSFGGVIIDDQGTIRVGDIDLHPHEQGHALALLLDITTEEITRRLAGNNNEPIETIVTEFLSDPLILSDRQQLLSMIVKEVRLDPEIDQATPYSPL